MRGNARQCAARFYIDSDFWFSFCWIWPVPLPRLPRCYIKTKDVDRNGGFPDHSSGNDKITIAAPLPRVAAFAGAASLKPAETR
jgi:hypothetical protein